MWRYHAHPEIWFIVVCAAVAYWYALTRIGPRVVPRGTQVASRAQVASFAGGLALLWLASDWPIHDLAENYLYSAHMLDHMIISLMAPPLLLLGIPAWLTRRILRPRALGGTVRVACRPLTATIIYNSVIAIGHAPFYVNGTLEHHFLHFWAHLLLFVASMIMWFPVVNKLPEYPTMSPPIKMGYLFIQSIVPNVPVAFLALATGVVYKFYATVPHPWISALTDQQVAGAIMKVGGTFFLWSIILEVFFKWAGAGDRGREAAEERAASAAAGAARARGGAEATDDMPAVLTWEHVAEELAKTQPARPGP
ncbi:MAG TPA: cytochrome c oxidase assembly protein [Acidimicrobiales bacterium]|nr:cytochrome c oxidase assembly protein [Acidimicrobiales bacterium]